MDKSQLIRVSFCHPPQNLVPSLFTSDWASKESSKIFIVMVNFDQLEIFGKKSVVKNLGISEGKKLIVWYITCSQQQINKWTTASQIF